MTSLVALPRKHCRKVPFKVPKKVNCRPKVKFLKLWQVDHFLLWGFFKFITRKEPNSSNFRQIFSPNNCSEKIYVKRPPRLRIASGRCCRLSSNLTARSVILTSLLLSKPNLIFTIHVLPTCTLGQKSKKCRKFRRKILFCRKFINLKSIDNLNSKPCFV